MLCVGRSAEEDDELTDLKSYYCQRQRHVSTLPPKNFASPRRTQSFRLPSSVSVSERRRRQSSTSPNDMSRLFQALGLDNGAAALRTLNAPRIDSYRFSMANLEDTLDVDLDAILGELFAFESQYDAQLAEKRGLNPGTGTGNPIPNRIPVDSRTAIPSTTTTTTITTSSGLKIDDCMDKSQDTVSRTDSPDNDSAFSDNVSMLSSESSASSGAGASRLQQTDAAGYAKAEKIRLALAKLKEANVQKLFIKVFAADGSSKSLMVDENMTVSHVCGLLAGKNHVNLTPDWALAEYLPDLALERVYEDHELLVRKLLDWTRDSKNRLIFSERPVERTQLFDRPETFLMSGPDAARVSSDSRTAVVARSQLLEDLFGGAGVPALEGPLYLKSDSKKGWKRYNFVLRASGLYYWPKDKGRSAKDLVCLATFDTDEVYYGLGWRKKYKAPSDHGFALKHPRLQQIGSKSVAKFIKMLCAEDNVTMQRWVMGIRLAKYSRQLLDNYRTLNEEIATAANETDVVGTTLFLPRSCSQQSVSVQGSNSSSGTSSVGVAGRRASSSSGSSTASSSSGCLSDADFPTGTIKRKPSAKQPQLPLTTTTRQLKQVGDGSVEENNKESTISIGIGSGCATLVRRPSRRRTDSIEQPPPSSPLLPPPPPPMAASSPLPVRTSIPTPPPSSINDLSASTLSLDSLPPPPPPSELPVYDSCLSLPPPPPSPPPPPPPPLPPVIPPATTKPVKRITFADEVSTCGPPRPPRRAETTRLSVTAPPRDFLKDLQRVMRKKWQISQKCKADTTMSPHEVLGFRDPPPPIEDDLLARDIHVSHWVNEHYGNNLYENVYRSGNEIHPVAIDSATMPASIGLARKRPPPPPPKRSETTQLTTTSTLPIARQHQLH